MSQAIDDRTYEEIFDIDEEAERSGTGVIADPYPAWADLLARGPVHRGTLAECMGLPAETGGLYKAGMTYYSVFSYAGVSDVFTRKDDFGSEFYQDTGVNVSLGDNILSMDGLRHRRYRDLIQEHFQPANASGWWNDKVIEGLVDELVGRFSGADTVDLNSQFFARLPMHTVTKAFGLSPEQGVEFRRLIQTLVNHHVPPQEKMLAAKASDAILESVIKARRLEPQDDVISRLAQAQLEEEDGSTRPLTVEEIIAYCRLIVFAGGGTTWKQLGIITFALLNNRDQLEAVMADRSLLPNAILESARWYPNDPLFPRKAKRDTVLQGAEIPKGAVMHLCLGSANRDPSRWDNPDKYDLFRPVQRSVAFAAGPHSCLGQHVARQEMLVALNTLFDRFPNIRWDPDAPPPALSGGMLSRGPGPLRVKLN